MTRGRLTAYLRYQAQDYVLQRAALPVVVTALFGVMTWKAGTAGIDWKSVMGHRFLGQMFSSMSSMFLALGTFIGIARLVTDDRSNGYFRFLFSKPVSLTRFYVQQWLLIGVGMVAFAAALAVWLQAGTDTLPITATMTMAGLWWVLIGGAGFALTALTNYDALLLVLLYVFSSVFHALKDTPRSPLPGWMQQLTRALPPTQKIGYIQDQLYAGNPMPWGHAWHVLGYGAACFVIGVVLLRRSSFAR